ncbi:hypothetical protein FQZ97_736480 [compost metagenome]
MDGFDLGHPVHQLVAVGVDVVADGVDDHLAGGQPAGAHHAGAGEKGLAASGAAPHVHAGIAGRAFLGVKLLAQHRVDAVAAHRDATAHRGQRVAVVVLEARRDGIGVLLHARAPRVDHYAVVAQALAHGGKQGHLQIAAMDGVLRPVVARVDAGGLAIDELAMPRIEHRFARAHGDLVQGGQEAQLVEFAGGVGQQVDPHAQRLDLAHGFVHPAGDAGLVQAQRQHQAPHAGADNDHIGVCFHGYTISTLSVPRPSTPPTIRSPRTTGPTPSGVPV